MIEMRVVTSWTVVGLLLWLGCAGARAENPRIHLKLENVTAAEAAEALGSAANASITLTLSPNPDKRLLEKRSFNWSDITLADALRQIVEQYPLRANRFGNRYLLTFFPVPGPALAYQNLVEKHGVRVFLRRVTVSNSRNVNFDGGPSANAGTMSIAFGAELPNGDAEGIVGLENVSAKDDQGNILTLDRPNLLPPGISALAGRYPDEWEGNVFLPSPHPKAHKLVWLEGDLLAYRVFRRHPLEIPVADKGKPQPFRGATVELTRVESLTPLSGARPTSKDVSVEVQLAMPKGTEFALDRLSPLRLVGKSGKVYQPLGASTNSGGDRTTARLRVQVTFQNVDEAVDRVVVTALKASDPQPLVSFRMTDVPLPVEAPFVPRRAPDPRAVAGANVPVRTTDFAFRQEVGGGALVSQVSVVNRPAAEGVLTVGLAAREGDGWGPLRWTEVDVTAQGVAHLEQLMPGTYRMVRVFRVTKEALPLPPGGAWQNTEVTVTVMAGRATQVPPLLWTTTASPSNH